MNTTRSTRRRFLRTAAVTAVGAWGAPAFLRKLAAENSANGVFLALNAFCANAIYARDGKKFMEELPSLAAAGVSGIETIASTVDELVDTGEKLRAGNMAMRSFYTGGDFHSDDAAAAQTVRRVAEMAKAAKNFGSQVVAINAEVKHGKTDAEIFRQSAAVGTLGKTLRAMDMKLAVHYHTTEWEFGGREFLHLITTTDSADVGVSFDFHWSYRANGNSNAAVVAHRELFGRRATEFHLRQSAETIWTEAFGPGDIDYPGIAAWYRREVGGFPLLVLEQAPEAGTPQTLAADEVIKRSCEYARSVFG